MATINCTLLFLCYNKYILFYPYQRQKVEAELKKEKEIADLQQQLQQLKDMAAGKQVQYIASLETTPLPLRMSID